MDGYKITLHQYTISQMERLSRKKKIICFGCGNNLTHLFEAMQDLRMEDRVSYIVDNDSEKWGKSRRLNGRSVPIENPQKLKTENWECHMLLLAIVQYQVILKQVDELLEGTKAVCMVSPAYRYWYDRIIDCLTLRRSIWKAIVLQGEGDTCENAKALMQAFRKENNYQDYKVAWLYDGEHLNGERQQSERYLLRDLPLKRHNIRQIYEYDTYINRAKYLIYENKMIPKARREQIACYMNHGIPLKATKGKIAVYKDTNYVLSSSEHITGIICEQFDAEDRQIVICGAPRTDCLFTDERNQRLADELHIKQYDRMILWAPTFRVHENYSRRDSEKKFRFGIPLLEQETDYQVLLGLLKEKNILLVVKPHIHQELSELTVNETAYIRIVKQDVLDRLGCNVYDLMKWSDAMITDYSSIGFDYMLFNRSIGYTIDDMEQYTIGFSVPNPLDYMPGMKMKKTGDLLAFIDSVACRRDDYTKEREKLRDRLYTYQDGNNSKRLLELLGLA